MITIFVWPGILQGNVGHASMKIESTASLPEEYISWWPAGSGGARDRGPGRRGPGSPGAQRGACGAPVAECVQDGQSGCGGCGLRPAARELYRLCAGRAVLLGADLERQLGSPGRPALVGVRPRACLVRGRGRRLVHGPRRPECHPGDVRLLWSVPAGPCRIWGRCHQRGPCHRRIPEPISTDSLTSSGIAKGTVKILRCPTLDE